MPKTFELISSYTVPTATTDVDISAIPSTYSDLFLTIKGNSTTSMAFPFIRFNNDTSSIYTSFGGIGAGEGPTSTHWYTNELINGSYLFNFDTAWTNSGMNDHFVLEAIDYANTNKHKTVLAQASSSSTVGYDGTMNSIGLWKSTSAISTINCRLTNSGVLREWAVGTKFNLWGIKGA